MCYTLNRSSVEHVRCTRDADRPISRAGCPRQRPCHDLTHGITPRLNPIEEYFQPGLTRPMDGPSFLRNKSSCPSLTPDPMKVRASTRPLDRGLSDQPKMAVPPTSSRFR